MSVVFTFLRQGEKLHEELVAKEEVAQPTRHQKILVVKANEIDVGRFKEKIKELDKLAIKEDVQGVRKKIKEIVPEFSHQA